MASKSPRRGDGSFDLSHSPSHLLRRCVQYANDLFSQAQGEAVLQLRAQHAAPDPALDPLVLASARRVLHEQSQAEYSERLAREIPVPGYTLPMLFSADVRRKELDTLAAAFTAR